MDKPLIYTPIEKDNCHFCKQTKNCIAINLKTYWDLTFCPECAQEIKNKLQEWLLNSI
jgi:hypothetical protein